MRKHAIKIPVTKPVAKKPQARFIPRTQYIILHIQSVSDGIIGVAEITDGRRVATRIVTLEWLNERLVKGHAEMRAAGIRRIRGLPDDEIKHPVRVR